MRKTIGSLVAVSMLTLGLISTAGVEDAYCHSMA
jgi:hypothetical protein